MSWLRATHRDGGDIERSRRARAHGWRYDDRHERDVAWRIHGTSRHGVAWTIDYNTDHSSSSPNPELRFSAPSLAASHPDWLLIDAQYAKVLSNPTARTWIGRALWLGKLFSSRLDEYQGFAAAAKDLGAGSPSFREHYRLVGVNRAAINIIDASIESLLLNWPNGPAARSRLQSAHQLRPVQARRGRSGLHIAHRGEDPGFEEIEHLARLGEALSARITSTR